MTEPTHETGGNTALVLFSGGQDSATCLAWTLARFSRVETLGFDYGQRHAVEADQWDQSDPSGLGQTIG